MNTVISMIGKYRITVDIKVETDIIVCITASLIAEITFVETFKTDVVFIGNIITELMSH